MTTEVATDATCVCNRAITTEPYYGIEFPGEPIVFFDGRHWGCLDEWGWAPSDDPIGIAHDHRWE